MHDLIWTSNLTSNKTLSVRETLPFPPKKSSTKPNLRLTHKRVGKYRIEACSTHWWSRERRNEEVKYRRFIRRVALLPIRCVCTRARIPWNTLSRMNNVSGRADSARHGPTFRRPGPNIDGRACACTRAILPSAGWGEVGPSNVVYTGRANIARTRVTPRFEICRVVATCG